MIVDGLTPRDLPRCAELEAKIFAGDSPWPLAGFVEELRTDHNHYFALRTEPGAPIAGYAGLAVLGRDDDHECEVHTIAVDPEFQGHGGGRALLAALLAVADGLEAAPDRVAGQRHTPVFLEVRTDNEPAIALYTSNGFEIAGVRRNYYQPSGADAYTMVRPAPPENAAAPEGVDKP